MIPDCPRPAGLPDRLGSGARLLAVGSRASLGRDPRWRRDCGGATTGWQFAPESTGPFDGLQAEYALVPFAPTNLVVIPPGVSDERAIMVSDIFPTGWFGARLAEVGKGDVVAVFGPGRSASSPRCPRGSGARAGC